MRFVILLLGFFLFPVIAFAHRGIDAGGFRTGLLHPVLGLDHFLAMVSVGILSAQIGGKAVWTVPVTFVVLMLGGGLMGMNGIPVVPVELGIAFSVFALGIALAAEKVIPVLIAVALTAVFAIFHGHAHGTEMPIVAEPFLYSLGFVTGTAAIHVMGVATGIISKKTVHGPVLLRYTGAGIAGIGLHLLLGLTVLIS